MTVNAAIPFLVKVVILMMKLKYSICCGLDVHKNVIVATIVTTGKNGISEYTQKSFSTINSDIQRFHNWLIKNNCSYGRIKKRRGHKKAIIAIARMMMVCIYHMVSEKKPFTPTDYEELMNPQNLLYFSLLSPYTN